MLSRVLVSGGSRSRTARLCEPLLRSLVLERSVDESPLAARLLFLLRDHWSWEGLIFFTGMATGFPAFFSSYGSCHFSPKGGAGNPNCLSFRCTADHGECGHLCGTARIAFPLSVKKCVTVRHTQTQLCTTRTLTLTETHHKQCAAQRVTCVSKSAHVRAQPCLKFSPPSSPTILPGLRCAVT